MRNANCRSANRAIYQRLAEIQLADQDRLRAMQALRDAEAIMHAVIRAKDALASLGALLLKPVFKH